VRSITEAWLEDRIALGSGRGRGRRATRRCGGMPGPPRREGSRTGRTPISRGRRLSCGPVCREGHVLWWLWGLFDDIAEALAGFLRGGQYSRRQRERKPIPDVRSMPFSRAWETLVLSGFDVKVSRVEPRPAPMMGVVVGQYPPPGRVARRNARVRITVHHPPDPAQESSSEGRKTRLALRARSTRVPDVLGLPFSEAWEKLTLADFAVRLDRREGDPRPVIGPVIAQDPSPGTMAPYTTRVRLTVGPARTSEV
jgi:beta-lactam-binding protein with PASTA domain